MTPRHAASEARTRSPYVQVKVATEAWRAPYVQAKAGMLD